jgi:hypothetical protein
MEEQQEVVAIYIAVVQWDRFLAGLLPKGTPGMHVILSSSYGEVLTYEVKHFHDNKQPGTATLIGENDAHFNKYNGMAVQTQLSLDQTSQEDLKSARSNETRSLSEFSKKDNYASDSPWSYSVALYPTNAFENSIKTQDPLRITIAMAVIFFIAILLFHLHARFVHNRQQMLAQKANRTALVVKSLFPSNVRDRIMNEAEESHTKRKASSRKQNKKFDGQGSMSDRGGGNSILGGISLGSIGSRYSRTSRSNKAGASPHERKGSADSDYGITARNNSLSATSPYGSKPIADHFAATTVLYVQAGRWEQRCCTLVL